MCTQNSGGDSKVVGGQRAEVSQSLPGQVRGGGPGPLPGGILGCDKGAAPPRAVLLRVEGDPSNRQRDCLNEHVWQAFRRGLSEREIASELSSSVNYIHRHIRQLIRVALSNGTI